MRIIKKGNKNTTFAAKRSMHLAQEMAKVVSHDKTKNAS